MEEIAKLQGNKDKIIVQSLNLVLGYYIIAWTLLPLFRSYTNYGVYRLVFLGVVLTWVLTTIFLRSAIFQNFIKMALPGFFYFLIMILYFLFNYGDITFSRMVGPGFLFLYAYMGYYYLSSELTIKKNIIVFIIICYSITSLSTIYNLLDNMNASRLLTSSSTSEDVNLLLERRNIGSFDFIYGLIIIFPILILNLKRLINKKSILKTSLVGFFTIMLFTVIALSNFTTAYFLLFLAIALSLLPNFKNVYIAILLYSALLILVSPLLVDFLIWSLNFIKSITPSLMTQIKLTNLIEILYGSTNYSSATSRVILIENSIKSFVSSPLNGVGAYYTDSFVIGNHSQLIDDLGRFGLIGVFPMLLFLYILIKMFSRKISDREIRVAYIYGVFIFILLSLTNPIFSYGITFTMFITLPLIANYLSLKENKQ